MYNISEILALFLDKVYMFVCIKFVSLYVLYEIMWNTCVTLIPLLTHINFIMVSESGKDF